MRSQTLRSFLAGTHRFPSRQYGVLAFAILLVFVATDAKSWDRHFELGDGFRRPRIGVEIRSMTRELREFFGAPPDRGLLVVRTAEGSPAAEAGVKVGDVFVSAGGASLHRPIDLVRAVSDVTSGQALDLKIVRERREVLISVTPVVMSSPWVAPDSWDDWFGRGLQRGEQELRRRLEDLERRLDRLENNRLESSP